MTSCLYECLREVGLQRHHARFASMGVCRVAHLSTLTPEDYPVLGIHAPEDRTRLFHLVRLVQSVGHDTGHHQHHGDATDGGGASESRPVGGDTSQNTESPNSSTPVRRCLDFRCAAVDPYPEPFESPSEPVHQRRRSSGNHLPEGSLHCFQSDIYHHAYTRAPGENSEPSIPRRHLPAQSPRTPSSAGPASTHKLFPNPNPSPNPRPNQNLNPRHKIAGSKRSNKNKVKKGLSRAAKPGKCGEENSGTCRPMTKPTPVCYSDRAAGYYNYGLPLHSPPSPNKTRAGEQRISVCVRKRCLTRAEDKRGEADVVTAQGGECVLVHQSKEAVDLTRYILQHRFYFDQVFGEESANEEVYQSTAFPLVLHMLNGGKATCFAYGQTGAGKTHTMLGSSGGSPGLYALAARDIFTHLHATRTPPALLVYVSFLEIYCGQLYDLLDHRKRLFAREDGKGVVQMAGLREVPVDTVESLMEVICWGSEERTQGVSGVNPVSSRSHALLQIQLRSPEQQLAGRMWFVDLAGSERAVDSREPDRQTRIEGAEINQSLLALKECIRSLDQEQSHTPFRQSKLTQVLKDSFVGNSKTCMIANISPGHLATEHTLNTLRYADRVKELREQGGVRGGGLRTKGTSLSKPNQTSTSSSNGGSTNTRDKSSPKRPKLNHRDALGPNTPPKRLPVSGATLGSTPKNSPREEGRAIRGREQETGIEHLTPVRCHRETLGPDTPSKRQPTAGDILCSTPKNSIGDRGNGIRDRVVKQDAGVEHLTPVRCPAEWKDGEQRQRRLGRWGDSEDDDRRNPKEGNDRRECINHILPNRVTRQLDSQKAGLRERRDDLLKAGGREEEERHLRWYHQQLQQFTPLAALQSAHPSESSSSVSVSLSSSSNSPTVSASSSSSPKLAFSPVVYHGLKELLNVYRAGIEIQTGVGSGHPDQGRSNVAAPIQTSTSVNFLERSKSTWTTDDADGVRCLRAHCGLLTKQQETADVEVSYEREVGESREVAGGAEGREMELAVEEGQRRWAWVTTAPTEETDVATSTLLSQEVSVMSSGDPGDHWRQTHLTSSSGLEEEYNDDWIEGRHGYCDNIHLFHQHQPSCPHQDLPQHLAPAERPLSPACEPTDHHLTGIQLGHLSLESKDSNTSPNVVPPLLSLCPPQGVPLVITSERESGQIGEDFAVKREMSRPQYRPTFATWSRDEVSSSVFNRCREQPAFVQSAIESPSSSEVHMCSVVKTCDSSPDESFVGSLSCGMDPLSLSQLEVSRQAASKSFLCGENNNISPCLLETEEEEVTRTIMTPYYNDHKEDVDGDADLLWEMSKAKPSFPVVAPIGVQEVVVMKGSRSQPGTRGLGTTAGKPLSHPATSHPDTQSDLHQHSWKAVPVGSQIPDTNPSTQSPSACQNSTYNQLPAISTSQSESDLSPLEVGSRQSLGSYHSNYRLSPHIRNKSSAPDKMSQGSLAGSTNGQHITPTIHSSSPTNLEHAQWCVINAHLVLLQQMEHLCHKEETLMSQQHGMAFGDYVHRLEEIMERRAWCVQSMRSKLQQYLKPIGPPNTSTTEIQQTI